MNLEEKAVKAFAFPRMAGAAATVVTVVLSGVALAKGPPTDGEETGANNLSIPVILSEGVAGGGFPVDAHWVFATIIDPVTECTTGTLPGTPVSPDVVCYYDGTQVWWLSQRQTSPTLPDGNFWKTFSTPDPDGTTKTVVTAIDWGDLLESSPRLNLRRIRTEVTLLKDASGATDGDDDYIEFLADFPQVYPFSPPCVVPSPSLGCFAALNMSGAVPGTEQSINEIQGTDFGVDTETGTVENTGTETLIDPRTVKTLTAANNIDGNPATVPLPTGFDATIYSRCARLIIQQITGNAAQVVWDATNHIWGPIEQVDLPVVDIKAWQDTYTTEINAGGNAIYGFNWNSQDESSGTYRLTFLLDNGRGELGADPSGEHCNVAPNTEFTVDSLVANPGEAALAKIIPADDSRLNADPHVSSLSYLDITIKTRGGGGGGNGPRDDRGGGRN